MNPQIIIGLTGNIASGKSAVAAQLAELGATVIDADQIAHSVMEPGQPAYSQIVARFGAEIAPDGGPIDRRRLGEIVFRDPQALALLESIVHPIVGQRIAQRVAEAATEVVVIEAIKLLEAGISVHLCDEVWVVTAPRAAQLARLTAGRGLSEAEAALRIDAQPAQALKIAQADVVIENDVDVETLRVRVQRQWRSLAGSRPNGSDST